MDDSISREKLLKKKNKNAKKEAKVRRQKIALILVGIVTMLYCIGELIVAVWTDSLVLLSDGFHNLSDVISICIAYWALSAAQRGQSETMSYGWKRTETVGALVNGMFLLSLCLYVLLEAIPRFIRPPDLTEHSLYFLITAGAGIGINLFGAVLLGCLGIEAHQHAPGEHDHDHGHGHHHHDEEEHSHSDHDHDHDEESPFMKRHKKHKHKKRDHESHDHDDEHEHDHHEHKEKDYKKHGGKSWKCSRNMGAVFLHYVGDVLSSICVLITGLLMYYFPNAVWPKYLDPGSSVVIVGLVFFSTIGLVRECVSVLLQGVPKAVNLSKLRGDLKRINNVLDVHDLHVWELSDGVSIASVHVDITRETSFDSVVYDVKQVFHRHGIHSTTVQPEYPSDNAPCVGCAEECTEDRCCIPDDNSASLVDISIPGSVSYGSINNHQ